MYSIDKKLSYYLRGKGLDTSREPVLKGYKDADVEFAYKEPNNLYHFFCDEGIHYESYDFVFNEGMLADTKFYRILVKEWFYLLRVGGNLVIRFKESAFVHGDNVKKVLSGIVNNSGEILYIDKNRCDGVFTVIIQKINSVLVEGDNIGSWSFCIINPSKLDISKLLDSIKSQGIPSYEVLLDNIDISSQKQQNQLRLVKYEYSVRKSNLTTSDKKNKMLLNARYENVVIIDRDKADMRLADDWYKEMSRYGNYFEVLSPSLVTADGERCADWWTLGSNKNNIQDNTFQMSKLGILDYRDWDEWVYLPDPICILKKHLYHKAMWDHYSAEGDENTLFSHRLYLQGILLRANPKLLFVVYNVNSQLLAKNFPQYVYDHYNLGQRQGKVWRRSLWLVMEVLLKIKWTNKMANYIIQHIKKSKMAKVL